MADLSRVVVQLQAERKVLLTNLDKLDRAIHVLQTLGRNQRSKPRGRLASKPRRVLSAAARRRIAAAQRARWAKFRQQQKREK
jgi:hypothetical protein